LRGSGERRAERRVRAPRPPAELSIRGVPRSTATAPSAPSPSSPLDSTKVIMPRRRLDRRPSGRTSANAVLLAIPEPPAPFAILLPPSRALRSTASPKHEDSSGGGALPLVSPRGLIAPHPEEIGEVWGHEYKVRTSPLRAKGEEVARMRQAEEERTRRLATTAAAAAGAAAGAPLLQGTLTVSPCKSRDSSSPLSATSASAPTPVSSPRTQHLHELDNLFHAALSSSPAPHRPHTGSRARAPPPLS
jgi:hypothetical protein